MHFNTERRAEKRSLSRNEHVQEEPKEEKTRESFFEDKIYPLLDQYSDDELDSIIKKDDKKLVGDFLGIKKRFTNHQLLKNGESPKANCSVVEPKKSRLSSPTQLFSQRYET
mmetsp:Transcript_8673/g.7972  ORF Transcript_8673/g.7972 Transcript_8673/m.7972 type:complete len:112 (+) Transcript_8673:1217-1552(+)